MLSIFLDVIIKILNFIISFILTLVFSVFPQFDFSNFLPVYSAFFQIIGKGVNLLYFMSGDLLWVFGDIIIALFLAKHIVLPVVNFMRRIVIK